MYLISRRERAKEKPSRTGTNIRHIWRLRTPSKTKPKRKASAGDSHARIAQRRYIAAVENFLDQHGLDIRIRPILRQRFHKINAIHFRIRQLAEFRYFGIVQHAKGFISDGIYSVFTGDSIYADGVQRIFQRPCLFEKLPSCRSWKFLAVLSVPAGKFKRFSLSLCLHRIHLPRYLAAITTN